MNPYRARPAIKRNQEKARTRNLEAGLWRAESASLKQWKLLRKIGRKTGQRFHENITKGEASDAIKAFLA